MCMNKIKSVRVRAPEFSVAHLNSSILYTTLHTFLRDSLGVVTPLQNGQQMPA